MWKKSVDHVFTQSEGEPLDPRADLDEWHNLLAEASAPEARLPDARHAAAAFLLVQRVDSRVVMDLIGLVRAHDARPPRARRTRTPREAARRMLTYLYGDGEAETG